MRKTAKLFQDIVGKAFDLLAGTISRLRES